MNGIKHSRFALLLSLLFILLFSAACTPAPQAEPIQAPASDENAAAASVSALGFSVSQPISAEKLDELRVQNKSFVVYFQGKKSSENEDKLKSKLDDLTQNYSDSFLVDYYTIPIADYTGAKELLGGNLFGLVFFRPEGALVMSGDSLRDVGNIFNVFFAYDLIKPDDHGLQILDYAQVMEKIGSGESFILYVGRDTCPQCRLFSPNLEKGVIDAGLNTPVYYFYVESYHIAQENDESGAQEKWESDSASIGFQGTPALLYFDKGIGVTFDFFNNLFPEDAKSQEEFDESNRLCLEALKNWIAENNIK